LLYSYTSGTTGFPKGVILTQRGMVDAILFSVSSFGFSRDDLLYNPSASAWITIVMSCFNLAKGMTTVIPDGAFRIDQFLTDVGATRCDKRDPRTNDDQVDHQRTPFQML
jgi:acyl-coenzyme A synthetase/AMP-(fatty) acid ligase